jgi:hypothetical protein
MLYLLESFEHEGWVAWMARSCSPAVGRSASGLKIHTDPTGGLLTERQPKMTPRKNPMKIAWVQLCRRNYPGDLPAFAVHLY